jgi:hypothetical protein
MAATPGNDYFNYAKAKTYANKYQGSDPFGISGPEPTQATDTPLTFASNQDTQKKVGGGGSFEKYLKKIGNLGIKNVQRRDKTIAEGAQDYADFLAGQISRGERTPLEASDMYADFGLAYNVPGAFKTASTLGSMVKGSAPTGTVEQMRPFQEFAAKSLGIDWSPEDMKGAEAAAIAMGKTGPEEFSRLLGQSMLNSPDYIRKNPLAFASNLPFGGYYGVGYQKPEGGFTGSYRFKPPSTVDYS